MERLKLCSLESIDHLIRKRAGETKIGEKIQTITHLEELTATTAGFVILGIPEDIGVRANFGTGGAHTAWPQTLVSLLNIQSTELLRGDEIVVLGHLDFTNLMQQSINKKAEELRNFVEQIDDAVATLIEKITFAGKTPIVIGGGHNNCYPILKGVSKALRKPVNCINVDAHADLREMEGRHSGNGFTYAFHHQYLNNYSIFGLHENYNSQFILNCINTNNHIRAWFYDSMLQGDFTFDNGLKQALDFVADAPFGVELDLDSVERVLSSASTPSGFSVTQARQYIFRAGTLHPAYLHICEGATELANGKKDDTTGKLIAYLISDFIKAYQS